MFGARIEWRRKDLCGPLLLGLLVCWLGSGCGDDETGPPPPGENCPVEAKDAIEWTEIELDSETSNAACPEVTPEELNSADDSGCARNLEACVLVLGCDIEVATDFSVRGTGRLTFDEESGELSGSLIVQSPIQCEYSARATPE